MKKYLYIAILFVIIMLSITVASLFKINKNLENDLQVTKANEKALIFETDNIKNNNRVLQLTIDQLEYFNDSIMDLFHTTADKLKLKDDQIKQLQYIASIGSKTDTLILKDTIFIKEDFTLDTLLGDKWYNLHLRMSYPNKITASTTFSSEKVVIISDKKETVNPPKKCKLARWFQKKHIVVEVNVVEKNPYIVNTEQKFIKIIK